MKKKNYLLGMFLFIFSMMFGFTSLFAEVLETDVASIGETGYETLELAVTAANAAEEDVTIKLLADVSVKTAIVINNPTYKVTLDLNGNDIVSADDFDITTKTILNLKGKVDVTDNAATSNADAGSVMLPHRYTTVDGKYMTNVYAIAVGGFSSSDAKLALTGTTVNLSKINIVGYAFNTIYAQGGSSSTAVSLTLDGVNVSNDNNPLGTVFTGGNSYTIYANSFTSLTINDTDDDGFDTIVTATSEKTTVPVYYYQANRNATSNTNYYLTVNGGQYIADAKANGSAQAIFTYNNANTKAIINDGYFFVKGKTVDPITYGVTTDIKILGGYYNVKPSYYDAGYKLVSVTKEFNELDYTYNVVAGKTVKNVTKNVEYDTFEEALTAASDDDTLELLTDLIFRSTLELDKDIVISGGTDKYAIILKATKGLVLKGDVELPAFFDGMFDAYTETIVSEINNTNYYDKLTSISSGDVYLMRDVELTLANKINSSINIHLNGYDVNASYNNGDDALAFNFLITKVATINITNDNAEDISVINGGIELVGGKATGSLTIGPNVKVVSDNPLFMYGSYDVSATISGELATTADSVYATIMGNGSSTGSTTLNIMPGAKITGGPAAIYHPQKGTININGGTLSGANGVIMKQGTLNMSNGEITATGEYVEKPETNNNGGESTGTALSVISSTAYPDLTSVNITGGTLYSKNGPAFFEFIPELNGVPASETDLVGTIGIIGGTFKSDAAVDVIKINNEEAINPTLEPDTIEGKITFGNDIIWTKGFASNLIFGAKVYDKNIVRVLIDGTAIASNTYSGVIADQELSVTLSYDYLMTLGVGEHTIEAQLDSGKITGKFSVYKELTMDKETLEIEEMILGKPITNIDLKDYVSGGKTPYTFVTTTLPDGFELSETGVISGTPHDFFEAGTITVYVMDSSKKAGKIDINYVEVADLAETELTATTTDYNSIKLDWTVVNGATSYKLLRKTSSSKKYTTLKTFEDPSVVTYTDTKVTTGTEYNYVLVAINDDTSSSTTVTVTAKVNATEVTVDKVGYNSVTLNWTKVNGASGYAVYRSTSADGKYEKIATVKKGTTLTYKNSSLVTNRVYYYKIKAYRTVSRKNYYGFYSNVANGTPVLSTAAVVTGYNTYYQYARISWKAVSGATSYKVLRSATVDGTYEVLGTTAGLTYSDKTTVIGTEYFYKVLPLRKVSKTSTVEGITLSTAVGATRADDTVEFTVENSYYTSNKITITKNPTAVKYYIYSSTSATKNFKLLKVLEAKNFVEKPIVYTNTKLTFNKTYYYKVKAYNKNSGAYTEVKSSKTALAIPEFNIIPTGIGTWAFEITKAVPGASGYVFEWAFDGNNDGEIVIEENGLDKDWKWFKTRTNTSKFEQLLDNDFITLNNETKESLLRVRVKAFRTVKGKRIYSSPSEDKGPVYPEN